MSKRLIFLLVLCIFISAIDFTGIVSALRSGDPVLDSVVPPVSMLVVVWAVVVTEIGRLRGGQVGPRWIVSVVIPAAGAAVGGVAWVAVGTTGVGLQLLHSILVLAVAALIPVIIVQNRRHRLGLPKQRS